MGYIYHNVHIQPRAHMPSTMTMQRPHPRVVRIELDDGIPWGIIVLRRLHDMGISPRRIRIRQAGQGTFVQVAEALGEDEKVVAVEMHGVGGVGGADVVVENDADGGVIPEVVDIPFGGIGVGDVSTVGFSEDGVTGLICVRKREFLFECRRGKEVSDGDRWE